MRERINSKRPRRGAPPSEDRLSALPDHLLSHIISFLPIADAARTASVARAWRHLWTAVPDLHFDSSPFPNYDTDDCCWAFDLLRAPSFADSVDRMLSIHDAPRLRRFALKFRIGWDDMKGDHRIPPRIDVWIRYALDKEAEELDLHVRSDYRWPSFLLELRHGGPLKRLTLCGGIIEPPLTPAAGLSSSLRRLTLTRIRNAGAPMAGILSGCPLLEWLHIDPCFFDWGRERVEAPSLTVLKITSSPFCVKNCSPFEIHAPKIQSLHFIGRLECFSFTCAPFPANVELRLKFMYSVEDLFLSVDAAFLDQIMNKIIGYIRHAKSLMLSYKTAKLLGTLPRHQLAALHNLKNLYIKKIKANKLKLSKIAHLIGCFPNLEALSLHSYQFYDNPRDTVWLEQFAFRTLNSYSHKVERLEVLVAENCFKFHKQYGYDASSGGWIPS